MCQKIDKLTLEEVVGVARKIIRGQVHNKGNGSGKVTLVYHGREQLEGRIANHPPKPFF